jgi:hypothetical protein
MSTKIDNDSMVLEIDGRVIATAEFCEHAAADGHSAWIVSCHPGRVFTRNQAITAMVLAERLAAGHGDEDLFRDRLARGAGPVTDRLIRITTALAVVAVAVVAAIISYHHAYELVRSHGEAGVTARLLPFTVDGLIWAASMVVLDASRRNQPVPLLAAWSLCAGIVATVGANLAHGVGHGPVGALVSAWPALALVGSFELLMMLIRTGRSALAGETEPRPECQTAPPLVQGAPPELTVMPTLEQNVRARHEAGHSQRAIAREFNIDRRRIKRILDQAPRPTIISSRRSP